MQPAWLTGLRGLAILAIMLSRVATATEAPLRITVVAEGRSAYSIVVPDDAKAALINPAAQLLENTIAESAGARLPVVKESSLHKGVPAIYLGKSRAARKAGLPVDQVTGWGYLNAVVGQDIFLVGEDADVAIKRTGPRDSARTFSHSGTLKAVTAFLESQAGVRFLLPGDKGLHVPKLASLVVDARMKTAWKPLFEYVIGRSARDPYYGVANNYFGATPVLYTYGGHSYYDAVPAKVYGPTHPEYFALLGGVRTTKGNHLCISNPEVRQIMLREMESRLDAGYQWVELAQTDGYRACECQACKAIHPDPGERLWIFHRQLAEEMLKRRPGKKVMLLSYTPTHVPPKSFREFPENVVIQLSRYDAADFEQWAPYRVAKSVYIYNWGFFQVGGVTVFRTPAFVVEQVRRFLANDVRGIYLCGGLDGASNGCWGLEGPNYYAFGKAMGDPNVDPAALLREYVEASFGEAALPMQAFFTAIYNRLQLYSDLPRTARPFQSREDFWCHFFPPKLLEDLGTHLDRAKAMAAGQKAKARLDLVEREFQYLKATAPVYQLYRAYRFAPSPASLDLLASAVKARQATIDGLYPDGKPMTVPGLRAPLSGAPKSAVESNGRILEAPFNWDFALLRRKAVLPGTVKNRIVVPRIAPITLDGKLDEPQWQTAQFAELSEIGMGVLNNASRFKAAYDDRFFYLALVCELGDWKAIDELTPAGREGTPYWQESIDLMIDPTGLRDRHCHMIFNPLPDSYFDRRIGFIDDPLHPLYGQWDKDWNGKWEYAAVIDRPNKRWTAEVRIPYADLEVPAPRPGTIWTMNVGRTERSAPKAGKERPRYSLWSPNLQAQDFHDRSTFGEVLFQ